MISGPGLSPSRANDFEQCPLLYRLRVIDRVPEPPARATSLGTLVHLVLERLFDQPAADRTPATARALIQPAWEHMVESDARLAELVSDSGARAAFFDDARARLGTYFTMEQPARLEPAARELRLETPLRTSVTLRGVVDRIDIAPDGAIRVVDYKTGATPRPAYGEQAITQMRFYALLVERSYGRLPSLMRLLYLRDGGVKELRPTAEDVAAVTDFAERTWDAITERASMGTFEPKPSKLCTWCNFQSMCPEFDGAAPPLDPDAVEQATGVRPQGS